MTWPSSVKIRSLEGDVVRLADDIERQREGHAGNNGVLQRDGHRERERRHQHEPLGDAGSPDRAEICSA